jgi:hypothetical protein
VDNWIFVNASKNDKLEYISQSIDNSIVTFNKNLFKNIEERYGK